MYMAKPASATLFGRRAGVLFQRYDSLGLGQYVRRCMGCVGICCCCFAYFYERESVQYFEAGQEYAKGLIVRCARKRDSDTPEKRQIHMGVRVRVRRRQYVMKSIHTNTWRNNIFRQQRRRAPRRTKAELCDAFLFLV